MNSPKGSSYLTVEPLETRIAPAFSPVFFIPEGLNGTDAFSLSGFFPQGLAGTSVDSAGDVNGDGFDDLIISAPFDDTSAIGSGAAYVVFGKPSPFPSDFSLASLNGINGFKISGTGAPSTRLGTVVRGVGDINGDGFDDVMVGGYGGYGPYSATYVVFGKSTAFPSNLGVASLDGTNGFRIDGGTGNARASAGDINDDGFDDILIGCNGPNPNPKGAYVIFGKRSSFSPTMNVGSLNGVNGFRITGSSSDYVGTSVSGAGDINGDGFDDIIVGARVGGPYVVFGQAAGFPTILNVSSLDGTNGFQFAFGGPYTGNPVSGGGDFNVDGFSDLLISRANDSTIFVVFGRPTSFSSVFDLRTLDTFNGFQITSPKANEFAGALLSSVGDVNGDQINDIFIGGANNEYVVFGKKTNSFPSVNLSNLDGTNGFKITTPGLTSLAGAGDVNGDGVSEIIVGNVSAANNKGSAYVIFGKQPDPIAVSVGGATVVEGDGGTTSLGFTLNLSRASTDVVTVHCTTSNGSAVAGEDYDGVSDQLVVFNPGEVSKIVQVAVKGDLLVETTESFSLILENPFNAQIEHGTGAGTILNDDTARISIGDVSAVEGDVDGAIVFPVTLSNPSTVTISVRISTLTGSATAPDDYSPVFNELLDFAPLETSKSITIQVRGDLLVEGDETFGVLLGNAVNVEIADATGLGTIVDDDTIAVSVAGLTVLEGDSGNTRFSFPVTLNKPSPSIVKVQYSTISGSALAGEDFIEQLNQVVTFNPGEVSKTIDVSVIGDTSYESDKDFTVVLANPTGAVINSGVGLARIVNDDLVEVSIGSASILEGNTGTRTLSFPVTLSVAQPQVVTVNVSTADSTALAFEDYTPLLNQTLQFDPGEISKTISVAIIGDTSVESTETFGVLLSNPVNARITLGTGQGTILGDDSNVVVTPISGGAGVTFTEADGDRVSIKSNKGALTGANVILDADGSIQLIDLTNLPALGSGLSGFSNGKLTVTAKSVGGGNGLVNVGAINAAGVSLKSVSVAGDLGGITAGLGAPGKMAVQKLTADSLGLKESFESLVSGTIGVLKIKHDVKSVLTVTGGYSDDVDLGGRTAQIIQKVVIGGNIDGSAGGERAGLLRVNGDVGSIIVQGSVRGGATLSGIVVGGSVGNIRIAGDLDSPDATHPVTVSALGTIFPGKAGDAIALRQLNVGGNVINAQILAGYRRDGAPANSDAAIGSITVGGSWLASSAVAGVADSTGDGYGAHDTLIEGGNPAVISQIARITIGGTAAGTQIEGDHYGIAAQHVGEVQVGREKKALISGGPDEIALTPDFTILDFG